MKHSLITLFATVTLAAPFAVAAQDLPTAPYLPLELAQKAANAALAQCIADGKTITDFMYKVIDLIHDEDGTFITDPNDPRIQELLDGTLEIEDIEVVLA